MYINHENALKNTAEQNEPTDMETITISSINVCGIKINVLIHEFVENTLKYDNKEMVCHVIDFQNMETPFGN